jgi:uncharacterized protein YjbJ (UPF0337 family)
MDKDRIKGSVEQATGAVKETVGKVAGDAKFEVEGRNEKPPARFTTRSAGPRMLCAML